MEAQEIRRRLKARFRLKAREWRDSYLDWLYERFKETEDPIFRIAQYYYNN